MLKYRQQKESGQENPFVNLIESQTSRKPTGSVGSQLGVFRISHSAGQRASRATSACLLQEHYFIVSICVGAAQTLSGACLGSGSC